MDCDFSGQIYEHSPIIYSQIIVPLFVYPNHNKWVINPRQVITGTTKQIVFKKDNRLERKNNPDEEQAMKSVCFVPDKYTW